MGSGFNNQHLHWLGPGKLETRQRFPVVIFSISSFDKFIKSRYSILHERPSRSRCHGRWVGGIWWDSPYLRAVYYGMSPVSLKGNNRMASKWMSTAEAVRTYIKDGDQIALGGFTFNRNPMSITREIIRQHKKGNSGDTILNYWQVNNEVNVR